MPTTNVVTEACEALYRSGTLFSEDANLEHYILENRSRLQTIPVRENTAIAFRSDDPSTWHFACPVEAGQRTCLVVFFKAAPVRK